MIFNGNYLLKSMKPIVKKAGEILLSYFHKNLARTEKKGRGFVTKADVASEQYLIEQLSKLFPQASFIAED